MGPEVYSLHHIYLAAWAARGKEIKMSMTLEEAIKNREDCLKYLEGLGPKASPDCLEAVRWSVKSLKALRPVSREKVEKVLRGKWAFKSFYKGTSRGAIECQKCKSAFEGSVGFNFCPHCGAPMTDEAVEMVMERMEGGG